MYCTHEARKGITPVHHLKKNAQFKRFDCNLTLTKPMLQLIVHNKKNISTVILTSNLE